MEHRDRLRVFFLALIATLGALLWYYGQMHYGIALIAAALGLPIIFKLIAGVKRKEEILSAAKIKKEVPVNEPIQPKPIRQKTIVPENPAEVKQEAVQVPGNESGADQRTQQ